MFGEKHDGHNHKNELKSLVRKKTNKMYDLPLSTFERVAVAAERSREEATVGGGGW